MTPPPTTPPPAGTKSGDVTVQQGNQGGNSNNQQQPPQKAEDDHTDVVLRDAKGNEITNAQLAGFIEEMRRRTNNPNYSKDDALKYFESKGYKIPDTWSNNDYVAKDNIVMWQRGNEKITRDEYAERLNEYIQLGKSREDLDNDLVANGFTLADKMVYPLGVSRGNIPVTNPEVANSNTPQVVAPGITSGDTTIQSSDIPAQPQVVNVPPQPKSADVPAMPHESEQAKKYRLETGDNTPVIYTSSEGIYLTQKQFDDMLHLCQTDSEYTNLGIRTSNDLHNYLRTQKGLRPVNNNDANLAVVVGGDTSRSPGPVHTNETQESQQQEINHLNGETSGDITPQSRDINPYWAAFPQPYNFGTIFDRMPSRYTSVRRQYNIR